MPRWVFALCCRDPGHCTNAGTENYEQHLLTDFMHLHGILIRQLVGMGIKNFKVMDSCCTTTCSPTANTAARLKELRKVTEKDGIHFTQAGYQNLADRCMVCIRALLVNHGKEERLSTFFWRDSRAPGGPSASHCAASISHMGEARHTVAGGSLSRGRITLQGFHPYRRN
jgi:hypothetical protein